MRPAAGVGTVSDTRAPTGTTTCFRSRSPRSSTSLGPFAALAVLMFLIAFAMMWATDRLVSLATPDPVVRFSAAAFALFNPWVYAKIVAGHYAMVLSCAALALLVREACSRTPNSLRASIVIACLLPQLQFFLLALPIAVYITGSPTIDIVGLCLGGALTAMLAAYLTEKGDDRIGRSRC